MPTREERIPMTVAQIREVLAGMPDDTVLKWSSWDSEYDYTYLYGIESINAEGNVQVVLTGGYSGYEDADEDDDATWDAATDEEELIAEAETAAAESADTLYRDDEPI